MLRRLALLGALVGWALSSAYLAYQAREMGHKNCRSIGGLSAIEARFIDRQEAQTRALLAHGITFGIPKAALPLLLQQSRESQATFLRDLHDLAANSCT
jgi:hypothetical protein